MTFYNNVLSGELLSHEQSLKLADETNNIALVEIASRLRDQGHGTLVTYSRKVFLPLTQLCRDVCHYCTFAKSPKRIESPFMSVDEVLKSVREAEEMGCKEALFTLGERPELRYRGAQSALTEMGFNTTLEYVAHVAKQVMEQTNVLPHINAGCMDRDEMLMLRKVSASMGLMLESSSARLCEKGMPHFRSPDKVPARRLDTIRLAGELNVPFTSGILIGIGETRLERIESLLALRDLHDQYGHIQEIIIQNFRAKQGTKMAKAPEPDLDELIWTIAVARLIFGAKMSIQAPPNLSPGVFAQLVNAGLNDWGGVSPLTPDFVNPEAPWPHVDNLAKETAANGKYLTQRLTIYPNYALDHKTWLAPALQTPALRMIDAEGYARTDDWVVGEPMEAPQAEIEQLKQQVAAESIAAELVTIVNTAKQGEQLSENQLVRLFQARGPELTYVCQQADNLRKTTCGDEVTYVVTRNINYTNVCYFNCRFCAFAKGKAGKEIQGGPYDLDDAEISRRAKEAWQRGASEVCMQGGIHPDYTGQKYLDVINTIHQATPDMHIHAFSPLEVWQGAHTLGLSLANYLKQLADAGLGSLPGTAAEILDDEVREQICPDKVNTRQWLEIVETAHNVGLRTTATIMFGHVDKPVHWARHLLKVRDIQTRTGGFTEFVPLPYVPLESPLYIKGKARKGPTFRESVLMHAVARLALNGQIDNIQTSWTKLGVSGIAQVLNAGANDSGGTLMNETITRSAGAKHGQELTPQRMEALISSLGRTPRQRSTLYGKIVPERQSISYVAGELIEVVNAAPKRDRKAHAGKKKPLLRSATEVEMVAV